MTRAAHPTAAVSRAHVLRCAGLSYSAITRVLLEEFRVAIGAATVRDWVTYYTRGAPPAKRSGRQMARGVAAVPGVLRRRAATRARAFYDQQEAQEFSGDLVESEIPSVLGGLPDAIAAFPVRNLEIYGVRADFASSRADLVLTAGVDAHEDHLMGLAMCWVIHNDGLVFRQGPHKIQPRAGDWFLFDDRCPHEVRSAPGRSVLMAVTSPVMSI